MRHTTREEKINAYAYAVRGLLILETDPERQLKYLDFIDIYANLDKGELMDYQQTYPRRQKRWLDLQSDIGNKGFNKGSSKD